MRQRRVGRLLRHAGAASIAFAVSYAVAALPALAQASPSPVPSTSPMTPTDAEKLSLTIWISSAAFALIVIGVFLLVRRSVQQTSGTTDKDLEATRIVYGFWLIIGSLILTLAVVIITVNILRPPDIKTADVIAVITAVTGVIGTLIAAFFGVQAAGAGRSQALSTLDKLQSQSQAASTPNKLDPSFGPHAGNTRVSITGNGFSGATAVNFGTVPGVNFVLVNDGLIQVTTPPATDNTADVAVIFPSTSPSNRSVGTFYYYTVNPATGPAGGAAGAQIQIRGSGFLNATAVRLGTTTINALTRDAQGNITFTLPARPDGVAAGTQVDVTVVFPVDSPTNTVTVGQFTWG
jgi:hypothetical protein